MKLVNLTLPAFAFVEGSEHEEHGLKGRSVIAHIRSASIVEVFEQNKVVFDGDVIKKNFIYTNRYGVEENMVIALHYCATLDMEVDRELIKKEILEPAARWYCDYCTWEDENIAKQKGLK